MLHLTASDLRRLLDVPRLVEALRDAFASDAEVPVRQHFDVGTTAAPGTLLVMPAWRRGDVLGVKLATVFPNNRERGLASVQASYVVFDGRTGEPRALLDGQMLTLLRTAAASALAASYLARSDARRLLMVGAGALAPFLIAAHAAVRPIRSVRVWNRTSAGADALAARFADHDAHVEPVEDLAAATAWADVISCATLATEPLVLGRHVRPGTHVDLVGGYTPIMREADDDLVRSATVFIDTSAALEEAGDLVQPLDAELIARDGVAADLATLARGEHRGRLRADEITLFKSVGTALEDLAAAQLALSSYA